ncbi:hypothetical protein GCM10011611_63820 [Aliidongia dinghuensis]|uniref:Uncharacterized protein n=1 Tax=Aliidongia dinghuensis TaxID=1867774 RepID=A0A8J2Z209_9PROT|nr:hypothetical protein [Aliidongia dinghuensis]GGF48663.1 hypothetical protein GCM10011611_63820 [Aliidongia dinghuensis]
MPAAAQTNVTTLTLSDLKSLFVTQKQYFVLDDEQSATSPSYNHLHITQLDTTTGAFEGAIYVPLVPTYDVPNTVVPVTGKITLTQEGLSNVSPFGYYYTISFSWQYSPNACELQTANYSGAIMFLGYDGSGKMRGTIGGMVSNNYGACTLGSWTLGPVPFSGQLTK